MISVILTAYNRKEFLDEALDSLQNQTINNFEVILISNFEYNFKNYKFKINHIVMEGNMGSYLYRGIEESAGDIILFMDDDDLFLENKLKYLENKFADNEIIYIHNKPIFVDTNGKTKYKKRFVPPDFNMSCISIRKKIIIPYLNYLKDLYAGPDTFFYALSLCSNGRILKDDEYLTYYRYHNINTSSITGNEKWLNDDLKNSEFMIKIFDCKKSYVYLNRIIMANKLKLFILFNYDIKKPRNFGEYIVFFELWLYYFYDYIISGNKSLKDFTYKLLKFFV